MAVAEFDGAAGAGGILQNVQGRARVVASRRPPPDHQGGVLHQNGVLHQGRQDRRHGAGELAEGGAEGLAVGDARRGGEGSQESECEGSQESEDIAGGESSQRKDPAGVGQVVMAGAAVVVNGNAGFGEQG